MGKVGKVDDETLWAIALNGSPIAAAIALAILDERLGGKISELKKKLDEMYAPHRRSGMAGEIPAGSRKGGVTYGRG
jgi:hypothetical protein